MSHMVASLPASDAYGNTCHGIPMDLHSAMPLGKSNVYAHKVGITEWVWVDINISFETSVVLFFVQPKE